MCSQLGEPGQRKPVASILTPPRSSHLSCCRYFSSVRSVLQGACHMVAMHIACEPLVRQALRHIFQTRAVLNVKPNKKGRKMIDDSHPCFSMRYLLNKPVRELKGDEFLKLVQAEEDRMLEIKLSIDLDHGQEKRLDSHFR